jgi:hypothetical protein
MAFRHDGEGADELTLTDFGLPERLASGTNTVTR